MTLSLILLILFFHWFADFVMQRGEDATSKSHNFYALLNHTIGYSVCWIFPIYILFQMNNEFVTSSEYIVSTLIFCFVTFLTHTGIDFVTSKINSKLWKKGDTHNFFVSIGFDQFLHYVQLFLTYKLLTN